MARARLAVVVGLATLVDGAAALPCGGGPFEGPVDTATNHPDLPLTRVASGNVGVVLRTWAWRRGTLVAAYRAFTPPRSARYAPPMTVGWNFERRRDTCARFLIGVWALAKGAAGRDTSLEAVRSRMRLSPEEALFAARRLHDDESITFEPAGPVRSNAKGIAGAESLMREVRAKALRHADVAGLLHAGGTALAVVAAVIRADGAPLACGAPEGAADVPHRLTLVGDVVTLERRAADGAFESVTPFP